MTDDVLYHYTDAAGLLGILEPFPLDEAWTTDLSNVGTLTLRASDVRYLNDRAELKYGAEILATLLKKRATATGLSAGHVAALRTLSDEVSSGNLTVDWATHRSPIAVHAACFCDADDLLSQWRGYGANGGGYAIGVHRNILENWSCRFHTALPFRQGVKLSKVHYGDTDATAFLDTFIDELLTSANDGSTSLPDNGTLPDDVRLRSMYAIAQVKHGTFAEEREWRLVTDTSGYNFTEFRPGRNGLIPYVNLCINPKTIDIDDATGTIQPPTYELERETIAEVIVGPGPDQDLRIDATRRLLLSRGYNPDLVTTSLTPFRG